MPRHFSLTPCVSAAQFSHCTLLSCAARFSHFVLFWSVLVFLTFSAVMLPVGEAVGEAVGEVDIALKKPYTLYPTPTYSYCTDPGDREQLTDGETTQSYFWTQKGTVGWVDQPFSAVTVDLGKVESIKRFEFVTAAGRAGVHPPQAILVHVSLDGKTFYEAAELIREDERLNGKFQDDGYTIRCLQSEKKETKGRFVRFLTIGRGSFIFCDELRIFQGDRPAEEIVLQTPTEADPQKAYEQKRVELCVERRYSDDLETLLREINASAIPSEKKQELTKQALAVFEKRRDARNELPEDFQTILPLEPNHAKLYQLLADLRRAEGCAILTLGKCGIWDFLDRFQSPKMMERPELAVFGMGNETRFCAFNIFNAGTETKNVTLKLQGLGSAADITVHRVLWTDTHICQPVACALPEVPQETDGSFLVPVQPGLLQQIWLSVRMKPTGDGKKKTVHGKILCETEGGLCETDEIPLEVTVYPLVFPQKTALLLGGWDYTDGKGAYSVNEKNRAAFLRHIQARNVNAPWARAGVLMNCTREPDGSVKLDTTDFDAWIANWKTEDVREYFIFLARGGWSSTETFRNFLGTKAGTAEFHETVKNWMQAWAVHWEKMGISPDQINLLVHDEPNETMKDLTSFHAWCEAIRAGAPGVKIWEDPCYRDLTNAPEEFFAACDVLCPNRPMWLADPKKFDEFYFTQKEKGRTLHLYSCSGPQRLLDPYGYCLLQAWEADRVGAQSSFFWALGDGGGVSSWKEYFLGRNSYCPLFIDPNGTEVTGGKHMEAIRVSAQDFECLHMMRRKIAELKKTDPERAAELEKKLNALVDEVLLSAPEGTDPENAEECAKIRAEINWSANRDRTASERGRRWILKCLTE